MNSSSNPQPSPVSAKGSEQTVNPFKPRSEAGSAAQGPDRLTIAQLLPALDAGGVEKGTVEVNRALVAAGHRSIVVSAGGRLVDQVVADGGEHVTWNLGKKSPTSLRHVLPLRRWIVEQNINIVHARSRVPAWLSYLAWKKIKPPTDNGCHGRVRPCDSTSPPAHGRTRPWHPKFITSVHGLYSVSRYSKIMTAGQRVEVVSQTARDYVTQNYPGTDTSKIVLIRRGVDPNDFPLGYQPSDEWAAQWHKQYPHLQGKCCIALAGRLTRLKGHFDLFDVMENLRATHPDKADRFHALIIGGEDPKRQAYAQSLREAVTQRNLQDAVTFTGHRSDMRDVLASCGAVLSLSTKPESFGRSVLESVALGLPTLGYDHGGVGEVLSLVYPEGKIPLGDTSAIAQQLVAIEAGQAAKPQGVGDLTLQNMLDQTLAMYESL